MPGTCARTSTSCGSRGAGGTGVMRPWTTGRRSSGGAVTYDCHVCRQPYERPDLAACATHDAVGRHRVEGALELLNRPTKGDRTTRASTRNPGDRDCATGTRRHVGRQSPESQQHAVAVGLRPAAPAVQSCRYGQQRPDDLPFGDSGHGAAEDCPDGRLGLRLGPRFSEVAGRRPACGCPARFPRRSRRCSRLPPC